MKKNNFTKHLKTVFSILLVIYLALFIALEAGYYDSKIRKQVVLTEKMIEEFEADIEAGNPIDIKNYVTNDYKDYSNKASKAGNKISQKVEKFMTGGISEVFEFIGKIFS